ncbi:MAG: hypothetical protein JO291_15285 [Acidimicrobiia bacterium]|nr:hypothetical protein [Acidimicrobiia bacterium]
MAERNPSKQRRAAQNRAQREALAARRVRSAESRERAVEDRARREALAEVDDDVIDEVEEDEVVEERPSRTAARPRQRARYKPKQQKTESGRPSRSAPSRPAPARSSTSAPATTSRTTGGPAPKTRSGAAKPEAASTVPDAPTEPGWRGFVAHVQRVPGGKAVMFSLIFAVVAAVTLLALKVVQQSAGVALAHVVNPLTPGKTPEKGYEATAVTHGVTLTQAAGPLGILFAAVPVLICGFALDATRRPNRRRAFTIAAFGLGIYVVFFSFIGIFYFFSMAGLFFAAYQARKADPPVRMQRPRRPAKGDSEED